MNKLIKDGETAVIYSPGYGAGWSTWGDAHSCFDGELAQAIIDQLPVEEWLKIANTNWPEQYAGGLKKCKVEWIPVGTRFEIEEYDGFESIRIFGEQDGLVA